MCVVGQLMQEAVGNAVLPALLTVEVSFCPRLENSWRAPCVRCTVAGRV